MIVNKINNKQNQQINVLFAILSRVFQTIACHKFCTSQREEWSITRVFVCNIQKYFFKNNSNHPAAMEPAFFGVLGEKGIRCTANSFDLSQFCFLADDRSDVSVEGRHLASFTRSHCLPHWMSQGDGKNSGKCWIHELRTIGCLIHGNCCICPFRIPVEHFTQMCVSVFP